MDLFSFFKRSQSKDVAKDRLKLVLIHDRANCSTKVLEMMKNDIIKVISKYFDIDTNELDIQISQAAADESNSNETGSVLCANIPIKSMRKVNT